MDAKTAAADAAARQLGLSVLPLWASHLATAQHQSEQAIGQLLRLFSQLRPHLPATAPVASGEAPGPHELLEQILMGFQYQDRVSQMLQLLQQDMHRLQTALQDPARDVASFDIRPWLARLESGYAMDEQRHIHSQAASGGAAGAHSAQGGETTYF